MEQKTVQLRIRPNTIIEEGTGGSIVWMTPKRADLLIKAGAAELVHVYPGDVQTSAQSTAMNVSEKNVEPEQPISGFYRSLITSCLPVIKRVFKRR